VTPPRIQRRPRAGFTLIEVIVSIALFAVVMMGALGAFIAAQRTAANSGTTSRATDLAVQTLNVSRQLPLTAIAVNQEELNDLAANTERAPWNENRPAGLETDTCAALDAPLPAGGGDNPQNEACAVITPGGAITPYTLVEENPEVGWVIMQYVNCRPGTPDKDRNRDCVDDEELTPLPRLIRVKVFQSPGGRPITLSTAVTGEEIAPLIPEAQVKNFTGQDKVSNLIASQASATSLWMRWDALPGATSYSVTADGENLATVTYPSATWAEPLLKTTQAADLMEICVEGISVSGTQSKRACTMLLTRPGMPTAEYDADATSVTIGWYPAALQPGVAGYTVERRKRPSESGSEAWRRVGDSTELVADNILADPDGTCLDMYRVRAWLDSDGPEAATKVEGTTMATSMTTAVSGC